MKKKAKLELYSTFEELKSDRVERRLTKVEKTKQEKATQSLNKLKRNG
jgi:hypothetical protein